MAQGIFGGATSYEEQSLQDILDDIIGWIQYTTERKEFILAQKSIVEKSGFWEKIAFDFQVTILTTLSYFDTILYDLNLVKLSLEENRITEKEVNFLRNIGIKANSYNTEYGRTYREDKRYWHEYGNPAFKEVEKIYGEGRDYFVTMQDACNAAARLEDYHMMVTAYFEGIFEVVRHDMNREDAKKCVAMMGKYHRGGFFAIVEGKTTESR